MSKLTYIAKEDLLTSLGKEQFTEEENKQLEGELGQEYAFLLQFNKAPDDKKQQFLDTFDQGLLKDISLSLSSRFYAEDIPNVEGQEIVHEMYNNAVDDFMRCVGEGFHDILDAEIGKNLPKENHDLGYTNRVLNDVTIDLEKLRALSQIRQDFQFAMTDIHDITVPTDSAGYFKYMADRDECKRRMNEAGLHPDFCAGNSSTSRNPSHPLYQKKDYYQDTFLIQVDRGLQVLEAMGIDVNQKGATVTGLMSKVYESRNKFATKMVNDIVASYDTLGNVLTDFIVNKNVAALTNVNGVGKYSEMALNTLYQCRVKGSTFDETFTEAFHAQRGAMYSNFQIAPEFFTDRIEALVKLNNMADFSKTLFVFDGKQQEVPQASDRQYMKNLNTLTQSIKAKMQNPEEVAHFYNYRDALVSINNLAVQKYNSLSFFNRLFHPINSREMRKTTMEINKFVSNDLNRESNRVYVLQRQEAMKLIHEQKKDFTVNIDKDFEKDFYALGYKGLATSDLRKFSLLRMALIGKVPNETIFALPDAILPKEQSAVIKATIAEMKQEAKAGNKEYFDAMMDRTGEFIKDMKLPEYQEGTMTDIAAITGQINEMSRLCLDFTQIQPLGQYAEYAKAHPEVDAAEMIMESMGKLTNDVFMPVGHVKGLIKDPNEPLNIPDKDATAVLNAAEVVSFFSKNKDMLSGKKLTDIELNPLALQDCGVKAQQTSIRGSKDHMAVNEAIKYLQGEPNQFKPSIHDHYDKAVVLFGQRAQVVAKPQTKQKLVDREPAFKTNFTQTKTQERKTEAPTQSQTITKSGPTVSDK